MSMTDFYIHLIDERAALNTVEDNVYVHKKTVVENYSAVNNLIEHPESAYVVVMTVGYRTDDIVLRCLLLKQFKYLGVLGSNSKIETMLKTYAAEGVDAEWLATLSAPAGLPIQSKTPMEIAISIAAEIIKVKNSNL
jgi:xanthine dehydrogenase accessory factor